jgi:hypothetical protein
MTIGIKKAISTAIVLVAISACMGIIIKRLIHIGKTYNLQGLIDHERNHK